ncbi:dihydrolipoamide branched chain transacylase E2 [Brevipalpus obovatus]|uniref:dihydrolipoamide branched chain transacylase E2 n=1 Tax=Brevipalpus obovatus TaxID=246614 RepID=UPI003D9F2F52
MYRVKFISTTATITTTCQLSSNNNNLCSLLPCRRRLHNQLSSYKRNYVLNCDLTTINNNFPRSSSSLSFSSCSNYSINSAPRFTLIKERHTFPHAFPFSSNRSLWTNTPALFADKVISFDLSDIGEGISEVVLKEWFVNVGDKVNQFDSICEVQSDKASVTITSRYDGIIDKIHYDIDEIAKVGKPLVDIRVSGTETGDQQHHQQQPVETADNDDDLKAHESDDNKRSVDHHDWKGGKVLTTPAVRRLAAEHMIRLNDIKGTGRDGRIMKEDVLHYIDEMSKRKQDAKSPTKPTIDNLTKSQVKSAIPSATISKSLPGDRTEIAMPFTAIQRAMFKSMTQSLQIPHFGFCDEINLNKLIDVMPQLKKKAHESDLKLTFMPFFIKALSIALKKYPSINATIDEKAEKVVHKSYHNVGFAMDTKDGLVVPNVKDVQDKSVLEIAEEMKRLTTAGSIGKLQQADLSGGTITLSNIGSIGGVFGIPVIFPSQVVIGAIGQTKAVPRFNETDQIIKANIVNVLWSADHRVIDGATMARFSAEWRSLLEEPASLLLNLR